MNIALTELPVVTPVGEFRARYSENGLVELKLPTVRSAGSRAAQRQKTSARLSGWHRLTVAALRQILAGRAPRKFPPLDVSGTEFQNSVWHALRNIPLGQTKTYGDIARAIGRPKAVRAVGGACGANPLPVLVPCHRVLAANGKIGGFSGGLKWKHTLLACEGVAV